MNIVLNKLEFYINKLKNNEKFSFTRWGDGEWSCLFGAQGENCDKHKYFPDMAEDLKCVFEEHKGYVLATWPLNRPMMKNISQYILRFLETNELIFDWHDATVWEEAAMDGTIKPLIKQLEKMDFIIVSESSKRRLSIKYKDFIEIPSVDCYLEKENIKKNMIRLCNKYKYPVFGLSASMATNVIIDELYNEIGDSCWMIDFGSIWEPYIGKATRSYHHQYKVKELL